VTTQIIDVPVVGLLQAEVPRNPRPHPQDQMRCQCRWYSWAESQSHANGQSGFSAVCGSPKPARRFPVVCSFLCPVDRCNRSGRAGARFGRGHLSGLACFRFYHSHDVCVDGDYSAMDRRWEEQEAGYNLQYYGIKDEASAHNDVSSKRIVYRLVWYPCCTNQAGKF
jgi:hypothetical protein